MWILRSDLILNLETPRGHWLNVNLICYKCYIQAVSSVCFEGIVYFCNLCDHKATRQDHIKGHKQSKHEGLRYSCNQCEYQAILQGNLKTHQQSKHEAVKYSCN
jgi:hypothetical protein